VHHIHGATEIWEVDTIRIPVIEDGREDDIDVEFFGKNEDPISLLVYDEVSGRLSRIATEGETRHTGISDDRIAGENNTEHNSENLELRTENVEETQKIEFA
jgi:hypothetical protein